MSEESKEFIEGAFIKRFQRLLEEEFPTITVAETLQILMSIYLNFLQELDGPTFKHNVRFGHRLFCLGIKRFSEKIGEQ